MRDDHFSGRQLPLVRGIYIDALRRIAIDVVPPRFLSFTPGVTLDGNFYAKVPLTPNLRIKTLKRGGMKACFRFHGGIGGGISRNTITNHPPLKLFDAFKPINFQNNMIRMIMEWKEYGIVRIPVIRPHAPPVEASGSCSTGVHSKRVLRFGTFDYVNKKSD